MSKSTSLKALVTLLMVSFVLMMASPSSSSWGADARYLPTRSDPLSPVGPPRGEDPRFDRLYDIIRELLRNGAAELVDDTKYPANKNHFDSGPY